ncbi:MAG: 2OG-Fe(II) oxygenase [Sphingopyxis sp.]|uniref:cyclophane-containing peptide 2OG-Fe(II) oxygenase YhhC n=1 Tax=Sphingopyxis sp. TaxID=1908224 RepID=UPI001A4183C9|nr:cyclophane-containing peptide 2OG-Fe(II) oxygenase YhhC [Sphingopyxis sp.]MBL9070606.1 2OG-Fe(II) oxygenase [Sphingopyxis sp.]
MISLSAPDFVESAPFRHCGWDGFFPAAEADAVLDWLEADAPWRLRIESFYEQHEFSLLNAPPPAELETLVSRDTVSQLAGHLEQLFELDRCLVLVDVSAHRLTAGQTIRVHNDYLGPEETHRLLIQFNRGWSIDNGGLLMLFGSDAADDVRSALLPMHGSAFAFEISSQSFHAVSTIKSGERYTLVYTFRTHD